MDQRAGSGSLEVSFEPEPRIGAAENPGRFIMLAADARVLRRACCIIAGVGDSGVTPGGVDPATGAAPPTRASRWLRASGRAFKKTVAWLLDRIGFLGS